MITWSPSDFQNAFQLVYQRYNIQIFLYFSSQFLFSGLHPPIIQIQYSVLRIACNLVPPKSQQLQTYFFLFDYIIALVFLCLSNIYFTSICFAIKIIFCFLCLSFKNTCHSIFITTAVYTKTFVELPCHATHKVSISKLGLVYGQERRILER